ncbi:MAG: tetratricopeptide repeat protein [Solirubrobacteraceae bacterium]
MSDSVDHPTTLTARNNVGVAYHDAGRVKEAIAIHEPLLVRRERILGSNHPDTLATRQNLAEAYRAVGRVAKAIALSRRSRGGKAR